MRAPFYFVVAMILAGVSTSLQAQVTLNTAPQGVVVVSLPATGVGQNSTTYCSLPFTGTPVYSGTVSAVTANTISVADSTAPWTAGGLSTAAQPYFVKFLTGVEEGRIILITSNATNTLTLDTTDNSIQTVALTTTAFAVASGDTFEIVPGETLGTLFGLNTSGAPLVLNGGTIVLTSDTVGIYVPSLARSVAYFFNTTAGFWEQSGLTQSANNTIIYPYSGFTITRRQSEAALSITLMGQVPEVSGLAKSVGSNTIVYGSTGYPVNMTLSQLQLGPNWKTGTSVLTADTIAIYDSALARYDAYYQLPNSTWRKSGDTVDDQSSFVIPAGTEIGILQRSSVSGATSFLQSAIPYTYSN